jgi:hypothetical protein
MRKLVKFGLAALRPCSSAEFYSQQDEALVEFSSLEVVACVLCIDSVICSKTV